MDKRIMGLLGAIGALAAITSAQAAPQAPSPDMVLQARSYAEKPQPVPEALNALQGLDEAGPGVELTQYRGYAARRYARRRHRPYYRGRRR